MEDPVITVDYYTYERKNIERWFQTNESSPLTNLILPSLDLRLDVQKKEEIIAFLDGSDITPRYGSLRGKSHALRVSIKSPLNTWSVMLPRDLKLKELWEIAFRLTMGRYMSYELQHRNSRVPPSQDSISDSLASAVFRSHRQKFMIGSSTPVGSPFAFWTKMCDVGDGQMEGDVVTEHWEPISSFFNGTDSTGKLTQESCIDKGEDDEDSEEEVAYRNGASDRPYVFKLHLGKAPRTAESLANTLNRLDVLKQMFDAFINRTTITKPTLVS
ncbi:uncharacterized protein K460DRAFT_423776 [Cucurbitaria berberidis CBS 394.84]|uniref:peptidylprolyl isomerase n=1 Tax=Cucurbitaria berberidis CBS 394.84 TaxID=1168544 RepID=A0A9P4GSU9_9PLEO|nr:uncharacterized protein K460DRAFT_423776 [Cucurbitaria berberidis CBS 394.84]KAF1851177.1 hypothetical protein K460DRAFT_423776 [Cucurbitaria berberidis CBS 394.84]